MVEDVKAYNVFIANAGLAETNSANSTMLVDCDYIAYVLDLLIAASVIHLHFSGSTVPNQPGGIFWAVLNRLLITFQVVMLFLSEIGWPIKFFDTYFPVLGSKFGAGALGIFQCLIGAAVLSHHVDDFALVSAFFLFALGCMNMFVGLVFRDKAKDKRSLLSWKESKKAKGLLSLPQHFAGKNVGPIRPIFTGSNASSHQTPGSHFSTLSDEKAAYYANNDEKGRGYNWGSQAMKKATTFGATILQRPVEALPPYGPGARAPSPSDANAVERQDEPQFRSSGRAL